MITCQLWLQINHVWDSWIHIELLQIGWRVFNGSFGIHIRGVSNWIWLRYQSPKPCLYPANTQRYKHITLKSRFDVIIVCLLRCVCRVAAWWQAVQSSWRKHEILNPITYWGRHKVATLTDDISSPFPCVIVAVFWLVIGEGERDDDNKTVIKTRLKFMPQIYITQFVYFLEYTVIKNVKISCDQNLFKNGQQI